VIKDIKGNAAPAVSGNAMGFTTTGVVDTVAPTLVSTSPVDNATGITSSRVVLTFSENVVAGSGNIVISSAADTRTISVADTTQVTFSGNTANINPSADLQKGVSYNVTIATGVIKDAAGNSFGGISATTDLNFDTAAAVAVTPTLLITEVNSNAAGGDFFELYNYGTSSVDISGWKWGDNKFSFTDSAIATFVSGTTIAAGQRLIVMNVAGGAAAFRSAWGLATDFPIATTDVAGPGLGGGDAVVVYNSAGTVIVSFNYGADATGFPHALPSSGVTWVSGVHAGPAFGGAVGSNSISAVWDGVSTSSPTYKAAVVGALGAFAQPLAATAIGSPGQ
jgi:methionine-rich copper-binding protein CopC